MSTTPNIPLIHITPNSIICRYQQTPAGWAVVTASGKILAPSFYDLRHKYYFISSINGAGGWVVIAPKQPQPTQPALF